MNTFAPDEPNSEIFPRKPRGRVAILDVVRGAAIVAMVIYHGLLDMGPRFFGIIEVDAIDNPLLKVFARSILSTFLFLVGIGLVLSSRNGVNTVKFLRRVVWTAAAAGLVTAVTLVAVPEAYVRFGVLHAIALSTVIGLLFVRARIWITLTVALLVLFIPTLPSANYFESTYLIWIGISHNLPAMMDYVPLFPWFGVVLLGIVAGQAGLSKIEDVSRWRPTGSLAKGLEFLGKNSLVAYLVHQPILMAVIFFIVSVFR